MMNDTLLETIQTLQHRTEHLEKEIVALRQALTNVAEVLATPQAVVARYIIDGESYDVTQADVDAIRANLIKPRPETALHELVVAKKMGQRLRELPPAEREARFWATVESIRATSALDGTMIETEEEAAIDD